MIKAHLYRRRLSYLPPVLGHAGAGGARRPAIRAASDEMRSPPTVIPGLDPGIYVDGRIKSGHDGQGKRFNLNGFRSSDRISWSVCRGAAVWSSKRRSKLSLRAPLVGSPAGPQSPPRQISDRL